MKQQTKGVLLAAGGASLWGGSGAAAQYLFSTTDITTSWLVALRLLTAGILLTSWSLYKQPRQVRSIISHRANFIILLTFALLGMMNSQLTYFLAVKYSNAPTATVIQYLQPVIIIIWLALAQRKRPRRIDYLSIIIALIGTFYLVTGGHIDKLTLTPPALFWGIWCAFAAALYTMLPRPLLQKFDALTVCGLAMLISGIILIPCLLAYHLPTLTGWQWFLIVYIIIGGTMFSYTMFLQSIRYISPAATGILSAFEPLVATFLAITLLGTHLTLAAIIGSLLILFTTFLQAIPLDQIIKIFYRNRNLN
ncbi:EamA family transporter [Limosilactobacillus sp. STM2_1]|uniref:EamA family transporter n=1 Tax=Limosilactobacillus rudii TaxID=2759755 RepID=A0A7W3YP95_9LACO|nr:EamA family transporter [Limosilactobacillus rudii]MBB1079286.1 EamA family transporter [Limosilactobacillus rudii]MBB1098520.1 EamA family transporter [Limosilactobacillus rudii]MCD7135529.1 DMT family transporter [Limosilactobacillus rudii]